MNDPIIWRDSHGIPHVEAGNLAELFYGQGYSHATDRALQMLLMKIVGQGRVSEVLESSESALRTDQFFRRANWAHRTETQMELLANQEKEFLAAYCEGINAAFSRRTPWEFRLCRYRPEPWQSKDVFLILRMIGYLTLAQSQGECERLLIELVQAGVCQEKLAELFPGILGGLDVELIQQVRLRERIVPTDLWGIALPRMMASNNWVVSGSKSRSGKPILANDVHLEANRLPAVFCEMSLRWGDQFAIGGSVPGVPGILSGRNNDLAWGVTYAFADLEDSWIEKCRAGKFYREEKEQWLDFDRRIETIRRKNKPPLAFTFFENEHGVLDGDPSAEGYNLCTRWAAADSGAGAVHASFHLLQAHSVQEGMEIVGHVETSWNFVFADRSGSIGYQMSGRVPRRKEGANGFVPLPGWKRENDWLGFLRPEELPRALNPPEGFFATANEDLNRYGREHPINMPMGPYRGDRIRDLLSNSSRFGPEDMCAMQMDVYSRQAALFMQILKPLYPDNESGNILKHWDLRYTAESQGAYFFEEFYRVLFDEVFGQNGLGVEAVQALRGNSGLFIDFYANFDRVLLSEFSAWFGERTREEIFRQSAAKALQGPAKRWQDVHQFTMTHLFFNGKLPRWLGFDRGPYTRPQ